MDFFRLVVVAVFFFRLVLVARFFAVDDVDFLRLDAVLPFFLLLAAAAFFFVLAVDFLRLELAAGFFFDEDAAAFFFPVPFFVLPLNSDSGLSSSLSMAAILYVRECKGIQWMNGIRRCGVSYPATQSEAEAEAESGRRMANSRRENGS